MDEPSAGRVVIERGEVRWASLGSPEGSAPGYRRPVVVVQADRFNRSAIGTVVCVAITSNLERTAAPGNVLLRRGRSGLPRDSVVNVSQVITLDRGMLGQRLRRLPPSTMERIDEGLRLVLDLD